MNQNINKKKKRYQGDKNIQNKSTVDMRKIDGEKIKLSTTTLEMRKIIQEARVKVGLTQINLAQQCGLPKEVIRDYENGSAVIKQNELDKINRTLNLQLKKPKPKKILHE